MTWFGAPGLPGTWIDRLLALLACASLGFGLWSQEPSQTLVTLALIVALVTRLVSVTGESGRGRVRLALLLASTACLRTLPPLSLLSYTLAIYGALGAARLAGGIMLGLSLIEPAIAGPVLLATLLSGDWRRVVSAIAVAIALTIVFVISGHPWLWQSWPAASGNVVVTAGLALVFVAPAMIAAWTRRLKPRRDLELIALCGVVPLLVQQHLSYDLILLLPAVVAWRPSFEAEKSPAPRWMFAGLTIFLITVVPQPIDRLVCLGAWTFLSMRLLQRPRLPLGRVTNGQDRVLSLEPLRFETR